MSEMIHSVSTTSKAIAITFDDGPDSVFTRQTADMFNAVSGKATFFMIGSKIEEEQAFVRSIHDEGHEIGNHTYTHPHLTQIGEEMAFAELERTDKLIEQVIGRRTAVFRAPYLDSNEETLALAGRFGYSSIGALNLGTRDWETPGVDFILEHTWDSIRDGAILLFHDGSGGDRSQSMEAVRIVIDKLTSEGYELVTVSELLARQGR